MKQLQVQVLKRFMSEKELSDLMRRYSDALFRPREIVVSDQDIQDYLDWRNGDVTREELMKRWGLKSRAGFASRTLTVIEHLSQSR